MGINAKELIAAVKGGVKTQEEFLKNNGFAEIIGLVAHSGDRKFELIGSEHMSSLPKFSIRENNESIARSDFVGVREAQGNQFLIFPNFKQYDQTQWHTYKAGNRIFDSDYTKDEVFTDYQEVIPARATVTRRQGRQGKTTLVDVNFTQRGAINFRGGEIRKQEPAWGTEAVDIKLGPYDQPLKDVQEQTFADEIFDIDNFEPPDLEDYFPDPEEIPPMDPFIEQGMEAVKKKAAQGQEFSGEIDDIVKSFLEVGKRPAVTREQARQQGTNTTKELSANLAKFAEENNGRLFLTESRASRIMSNGGLEASLTEVTPDYIFIPNVKNSGGYHVLPHFSQYNSEFNSLFDSAYLDGHGTPHVFDEIKKLTPARVKLTDNKMVVVQRGFIDFGEKGPIVRNANSDIKELEVVDTSTVKLSATVSEPFFDPEKLPPIATSHEFTRQQIKRMDEKTARSHLTESDISFVGKNADDYLVNRAMKDFNRQVDYLNKNPDSLSNEDITKLYKKNLLTTEKLLKDGATFRDYFFGNNGPYILGGIAAAAVAIKVLSNNSNRDD